MFAIWDKNADTPPYHAKRNDALETGEWPSENLETCLHTRGVAKSTKLSVTRYMFTKHSDFSPKWGKVEYRVTRYMFTKHSPNLHKTYVKLTKNLYKTAVKLSFRLLHIPC